MGKITKTIVINEREYKLNIFIEKRSYARASFVNGGINIRLPKHLSIEEKNKVGKEMLDWAVSKISKEPEKYKERNYRNGDKIKAMDAEYTIHIEKHLKSKNSTREVGENILFKIANHYSEEETQKYIRKQVRKILAKNHSDELRMHVHRINDLFFKKNIRKIDIKHTTSRWGQCHTSKAHFDFSTRLLLAPLEIIEYVIIHEIAHLTHANHSKRFWNLVSMADPNYKKKTKWLRDNGHLLTL